MKKLLLVTLLFLLAAACGKKKTEEAKPVIKDTLYDKAWLFRDNGIVDSSFVYFYLAKERAILFKDSIKIAKCLINMAIIGGERGDYFGSQDICLAAIDYLNPSKNAERELLSSAYNELGKASHALKRYDEANRFYSRAISLTKSNNIKAIYLNNLANNYRYQKQYDKAISLYKKLLAMNEVAQDKNNYARIQSNYTKTRWLKDTNYKAAPVFLMVLQAQIKANNFLGQNASYAHLRDYYLLKRPDSAILFAKAMYQIASINKSPDDQLDALKTLTKLSPPTTANQYFDRYQEILDSIQTVRNADKNQFALIRYDVEKQKASNLTLQKKNSEKNYQLSLLIIGVIILSTGTLFWYRKRKQSLALAAAHAIQESQLKTSKKVHDVVANGLYRVMTEIENQSRINKEGILDRIEELYEKSRDISYDQPIVTPTAFHEKMAQLVRSFSTDRCKIKMLGNTAQLWKVVDITTKFEIEHVVQELLVNMQKHSKATEVKIALVQQDMEIKMSYIDNGVGLPKNFIINNGLTNTENRIKKISGTITFEPIETGGLEILISFPTA